MPFGVAKDSNGNVYIADTNNCLVRKVNTAGVISTVAGLVIGGTSPRCGFTGDGGPGTSAELYYPYGVASTQRIICTLPTTLTHAIR